MKEYIEKTIFEEEELPCEDGETIRLHVSRTRDTNGSVYINITYGSQSILFADQTHYEAHAAAAANFLRAMAEDSCNIKRD